jgi:D-beta-D-heptose 7-phosphate kinase/D-beta-D-heptose 1-phosphate adenosyltransferase
MLVNRLRKSGTFMVIGDLMLDRYIYGTPRKVSEEAPVLVLDESPQQRAFPGGAANVACKLRDLGYAVALIGIVGQDHDGEQLLTLLNKKGVNTEGVMSSIDRPTTVKTRVLANDQQVIRLDREARSPVTALEDNWLLTAVEQQRNGCCGVALVDYVKGTLSDRVLGGFDFGTLPVVVDPGGRDWERYGSVTVIKPNLRELETATGHAVILDDVKFAARAILTQCRAKSLLITLGVHGCATVERDGGALIYHSVSPVEVFDVTGAGDAVTAVTTAALASDLSIDDCGQLANYAGSVIVQHLGVGTLSCKMLAEAECRALRR